MRILFLAILVSAGFLTPWWCFGILAFAYALRYRAFELPVIGLLLDAASGVPAFLAPLPYIYIVLTLALALMGDYLRPQILLFGKAPEHLL